MVALNSHEITTTLVCMANFYLRQLENHSKHFPFHGILAMARWWWQSHTHTHIRTCFSTLVSLPFHFVRKIVCCTVHTLTLWNWVLHGQFTESCYIHYIFILLFLSSISLFRLLCPFSHFFLPVRWLAFYDPPLHKSRNTKRNCHEPLDFCFDFIFLGRWFACFMVLVQTHDLIASRLLTCMDYTFNE